MPRVIPIAEVDIGPDDLKVLRKFLVDLLAKEGAEKTVEAVLQLVARLLRDQAGLSDKLRALMRGRAESGTEKLGSAQLKLWQEALEEAKKEAADAQKPEGEGDGQKRKGTPKRAGLPGHLPRRPVDIPVEPALRICSICGANKVCIGHESSEVLELVPARFEVIVYNREKLVCADHPSEGVVVAPPVVKPLDGGIPGPGLLADVIIRKSVDHTPINRQLEIYRRLGVDLAANTVYGWWAQSAELLRPIADGIKAQMLSAHLVQADDTGIRVLDEDSPTGSIRGHMWGAVGDGVWVAYHYTETWTGDEMAGFLGTRVGWLQCDAYAGYERLFRKIPPAIEIACWSHGRRYLVKAEESGDRRAREHLVVIGELFAVEAHATAQGMTHEERLVLRTERSPPILARLWAIIGRLAPTVTPGSPLGKAHTYLTNQRRALERFLEDGRLPLENGAAERLARIIAVGRKNWLHCGTALGAERLAIVQSVLHTARFHGADLSGGLAFAFGHLASRKYTAEEARELLPDRWPKMGTPAP